MISSLLSMRKVTSFVKLLEAYSQAGVTFSNFIDGGAGMGGTARAMRPFLPEGGKVHAFEPFPGNWRFFRPEDEDAVILHRQAMDAQTKTRHFHVSSVVQEDSAWGQRGLVGYSSVGRLVAEARTPDDLQVECVRADEVVHTDGPVDFVKLDLQGAELGAIQGMSAFLADVKLMWVEFSGQEGLMDHLVDQGFVLFDTEYMFIGPQTDALLAEFTVTRDEVPLSVGSTAWFGVRARPWRNFEVEFMEHRKNSRMVQTDLVCVNRRYLDEFMRSCAYL